MEPQSTNYAAYVNVTVVNPRCANSFGHMFNIEKINLYFVPPISALPAGWWKSGWRGGLLWGGVVALLILIVIAVVLLILCCCPGIHP